MRWFDLDRACPEPCIRITREHLETVLEKRRRKEISEQGLVDWATMILANYAYYWEPEDQVVGHWVNRLSLDLSPEEI